MIDLQQGKNLPALPNSSNPSHGSAGDGHRDGVPVTAWSPLDTHGEPIDSSRSLPVPHRQSTALQPASGTPPPLFPDPPSRVEARWEFYDKLDLLKRGRWLIGGFGLAVLAIMAVMTAMTPREYDAYSVLLISEKQPGLDAAAEYAAVPGLEERKLLNQALIIQQSPEIAERTARRLLAEGEPLEIAERLGEGVTVERLARHLQNTVLSVDAEGKDLDAVRITASAPSGAEAARIASVYTEEYVARTRETSRMALSNARAFLESQLADREAELASVESQIQRFETGTGSVDLSSQTASRIRQVSDLEVALDRARVEQQLRGAALRSFESELAELQPRLRERLASGSEQELLQLNERIATLESTVEGIYQRNPNLRGGDAGGTRLSEFERQLRELKEQRTELTGRYVDEVVASAGVDITDTQRGGNYITDLRRRMGEERVALAGAEAEISALEQRLAEARGDLGLVPGRSMHLAQLRRQQATAETMVLYLTERTAQTRIAEETQFGLAQIIRPATVPNSPARPRTGLNLAIGLMLGLLLGVGAAVFRHKLDGTLHAPRDLHLHGAEVLGVIPPFEGRDRAIMLDDPDSPPAEAFRHLLANLRLGRGGPRPQSLVVTGAERGAGSSTAALNLAITAAQSGLKTLIIDTDLREPSVRAALHLTERVGSSQKTSPLAYWSTSLSNLFALTPSGGTRPADGLWSRERVRELLVRVRPSFDLIVFDAPPVLLAADASVIASQADAVLLVARAGRTHQDALAQAASELHGGGGEVLGAVLNEFHANMAHGYRHTFGYRHQQLATTHA